MKLLSFFSGAILVLALGTSVAQAQDDELVVMKNLYMAITSQQPVSDRSFAIIMSPGIALDPWLDVKDPHDSAKLFRLVDEAFQPSWVYAASGNSVSKIYGDLLANAQWASVPLTPQQRKDLQDVNRLLFSDVATQKPTADYQQYLDLKAKYDALQKQFNGASPDDRAKLRPQVDKAREDLQLQGQERTFIAALGKLRALQFVKPSDWKDQLQKRFTSAIQTLEGHQIFPVPFSPSYDALIASPSWTEVTLTGTDLFKDPSNGTYLGTIASPWRMLRWSQGPIPSASDESGPPSTSPSAMTLSFEYTIVSLDRSWLDPSLFQSRVWRYPAAISPQQISDGANPLQGHAPSGRMPLLVTQVILARNIRIDGSLTADSMARLRKQAREGKAASWGPFALSGKYFQEDGERFFSGRPYRTGIRSDETQIIGWITQVLPLSPNPDPSFVWDVSDNIR